MQNETVTTHPREISILNDLLQLDRDAVQAYALTIRELKDEQQQESIRAFRRDHERHIDELTSMIKRLGGRPAALPHASGVFKLGVQGLAGLGNDAVVLMAFRANERQVRDKYQRAADMALSPEARSIVIPAAADEARHFQWVDRTLHEMGYSERDFERAAARMHQRTADVLERGERFVRRSVSAQAATIAGTALAVIGAGIVLTRALRR